MESKTHVHCDRKYDSESDDESNEDEGDECDGDDKSVEVLSRTAVEQPVDYSPTFRMIKRMIKEDM